MPEEMTCEQLFEWYNNASYVSGPGVGWLIFLAPWGGLFWLLLLTFTIWGVYRHFQSRRLNHPPPKIAEVPQDFFKSIKAAIMARKEAKRRKQREARQCGAGPSGEEVTMDDMVVTAPKEAFVKEKEFV